jgi:hypothetical protein
MWFTMQLGPLHRVVQQEKAPESGAMDGAIECTQLERCGQGRGGKSGGCGKSVDITGVCAEHKLNKQCVGAEHGHGSW